MIWICPPRTLGNPNLDPLGNSQSALGKPRSQASWGEAFRHVIAITLHRDPNRACAGMSGEDRLIAVVGWHHGPLENQNPALMAGARIRCLTSPRPSGL